MQLGIEIGGTKLQFAVGEAGRLAEIVRRDVVAEHGATGILGQIAETVPQLLARHKIDAMGIGFGGPIDSLAGVVTTSHQIAGWDNFPLANWCREKFSLACRLANDCDAAALAEATWGAGRTARTVFFVTVGTGVGGGLVIDGRLHGAGRPAVAEIGHLRPGLSATSPHDTVESWASGRGLETRLRERLLAAPDDPDGLELLLDADGDLENITGQMIAEAAGRGNPLALEVLAVATRTLGWGIAQVVTLLVPETVVIGGGVSLSGEELFFAPVRRAVEEYVFPPLRGSYRIVPAELGEAVVLYGAVALAERREP